MLTPAALLGTAETNCQHTVHKEWEEMDGAKTIVVLERSMEDGKNY